MPGIGDPGPSSHPRGPPPLGQLSAAAAAAVQTPPIPGPPISEGEELDKDIDDLDQPKSGSAPGSSSGRTRGNRPAAMGTDEWARQRKDNHVCSSIHIHN
jgi:transcriptional regulator CBF1